MLVIHFKINRELRYSRFLTCDRLSLFWDLNSSMSSNSKSNLLASLTQSLLQTLTAIFCSVLSSGIEPPATDPPTLLLGAGVGPVLLNCLYKRLKIIGNMSQLDSLKRFFLVSFFTLKKPSLWKIFALPFLKIKTITKIIIHFIHMQIFPLTDLCF